MRRSSDSAPSFARGLLALLALANLSGATGCYRYSVRAADDSAAGLTQRHVLHSFFWGAVEGTAPYEHCALHGQAGGNGLWDAELRPTTTDILARVLTLGIWAPIHVTYDCAPERPHLPASDEVTRAVASLPDRVHVDDFGCFRDLRWENVSGQVRVKPKELCVPKPGRGDGPLARVEPLIRLVRTAERERGSTIRPVGAGWSFSADDVGKDYMVDLRWLGSALPLPADADYAAGAKGTSFAHFEAGASVDAVNLALEAVDEELLTMGGTTGQTWIGAVQTGTHGSAIDRQPSADHIWALDVVGEGGRRFWIESATRPLTNGGYAKGIGADFVQNDDIFHAALAGLGTFGIVYSAVVQVEPARDYKRYRQVIPFDADLRATMRSFDFNAWAGSPRPGQRPYHFEIVVDPYNPSSASPTAYVTTLWDQKGHTTGVTPTTGLVIADNVGAFVEKLVNADPEIVPLLVKPIVAGLYKPVGDAEPAAPLRELFTKGIPQGSKPQSAEFDFARASFDPAIDAILATIGDHQMADGSLFYFPGVLGIRFTKGTNALLGATIFPDTVTVEFAGIPGVRGLADFYWRIDQALTNANVPHTQHLGQANTYPRCPQELAPAFHPDAVDRIATFRAARQAFLSPAGQTTFASEYATALGLTGAAIPIGPCAPVGR